MLKGLEVPIQFWALLLGWIFTLYLQRLSNRRAEALKRKDKLIEKIEGLVEWFEDVVAKEEFSAADAETIYTGLLTYIELRIHQFNTHVRSNVISVDLLGELRRIDFFSNLESERSPLVVRDTAFELIDHVELKCNQLYFEDGDFVERVRRKFKTFAFDWAGAAFALLSLILLVMLFQLIFKFFGS